MGDTKRKKVCKKWFEIWTTWKKSSWEVSLDIRVDSESHDIESQLDIWCNENIQIDWCCFYSSYFVRNNTLVALLEALCALCTQCRVETWYMMQWEHPENLSAWYKYDWIKQKSNRWVYFVFLGNVCSENLNEILSSGVRAGKIYILRAGKIYILHLTWAWNRPHGRGLILKIFQQFFHSMYFYMIFFPHVCSFESPFVDLETLAERGPIQQSVGWNKTVVIVSAETQ